VLPVNRSTFFSCWDFGARELKDDNIHDQIRAAIEKHDISADQDVGTLGRRRSETDFQVSRYWLKAFLKTRWKGTAHNELALQSGRQLISFS
jgi:hypothetical protein